MVLNMTWLYMQELHRVLNMSDYDSICLINAQICLNMFEHVPKTVLNLLRYSYNNKFIIVTDVIILEFLSAQSVYPVALLRFYLFSTRFRT